MKVEVLCKSDSQILSEHVEVLAEDEEVSRRAFWACRRRDPLERGTRGRKVAESPVAK